MRRFFNEYYVRKRETKKRESAVRGNFSRQHSATAPTASPVRKFFVAATAFIFLTPAMVAVANPPGNAEGLQIGWARADLTPEAPVFITGQRHARISERVMDPITATALAFESRSGEGVIMVSCDLISIPDEIRGGDFRGRVRELVAEALTEEETPKVVLNATHTHAGPEVRERTGLEERLRDRQ